MAARVCPECGAYGLGVARRVFGSHEGWCPRAPRCEDCDATTVHRPWCLVLADEHAAGAGAPSSQVVGTWSPGDPLADVPSA